MGLVLSGICEIGLLRYRFAAPAVLYVSPFGILIANMAEYCEWFDFSDPNDQR